MGGSDVPRVREAYDRYGLRNLLSVRDPSDPDRKVDQAYLQQHGAEDFVGAWRVAEEPDIGGHSSPDVHELNMGYWESAPTKPTFVNTANANAFGEYGQIADVAATDHYVGYNAPSTIFGTWVTRTRRGRGGALVRRAPQAQRRAQADLDLDPARLRRLGRAADPLLRRRAVLEPGPRRRQGAPLVQVRDRLRVRPQVLDRDRRGSPPRAHARADPRPPPRERRRLERQHGQTRASPAACSRARRPA